MTHANIKDINSQDFHFNMNHMASPQKKYHYLIQILFDRVNFFHIVYVSTAVYELEVMYGLLDMLYRQCGRPNKRSGI